MNKVTKAKAQGAPVSVDRVVKVDKVKVVKVDSLEVVSHYSTPTSVKKTTKARAQVMPVKVDSLMYTHTCRSSSRDLVSLGDWRMVQTVSEKKTMLDVMVRATGTPTATATPSDVDR